MMFGWFRPRPRKFIVWYRDARPWRDWKNYLAKSFDGEGFWYSQNKDHAHRFDTRDEAAKHVPVYDGSGGIEKRTGVECVST